VDKQEIVKVIIRRWNKTDDYILFFPDEEANPGRILTWEFCGQHGEADFGIMDRKYTSYVKKEDIPINLIQNYEYCYNCKLKIISKLVRKKQHAGTIR
jgi:hypothetical protein